MTVPGFCMEDFTWPFPDHRALGDYPEKRLREINILHLAE